jgi:hypothetical protein
MEASWWWCVPVAFSSWLLETFSDYLGSDPPGGRGSGALTPDSRPQATSVSRLQARGTSRLAPWLAGAGTPGGGARSSRAPGAEMQHVARGALLRGTETRESLVVIGN